MTPITNGAAGLIGAIATPRDNFSTRQAARVEGLQLQSLLSAQKQQEVAEEQQAAAQLEAQLAAARALPLMGRDVQKLAQHLKEDERTAFERMRDNYGGNAKKWFAAEGEQWRATAKARLLQSGWYQQATQNRQNIIQAQEAIKQGNRIVGTGDIANYRSGEKLLQEFLSGQSDTFNYNGSYKPEDDLKHFRDQYKAGVLPWQQVAVTEEEKLNHLVGQYGVEMGTDKYLRQHKGTTVFYKTDKITDAIKFGQDNARFGMEQGRFQMEKGKYAMARQDQAMQRQLFGLQAQGLQLSNAKKKQELMGGDGMGGQRFDNFLLSTPSEVITLSANKAKMPVSGTDLSKVKKLAGVTLYGNGDEILARHMGLQRTKTGYGKGRITEAFSEQNGVNTIDLRRSSFEVVGIDGKVYYDRGSLSPNAENRGALNGYARVTIKFTDDDDADAAGLYSSRWRPDWLAGSTQAGTGVYDSATKTATVFVPAGNLLEPGFLKAIQKDQQGTKAATESFNAPYMPRPNF